MKIRLVGIVLFTMLVFGCCAFDGCDTASPDSDQTQKNAQEQLSQQGNSQVGMPGITNFTEKKVMRRLYEMRDKNIATFTYMVYSSLIQRRSHRVTPKVTALFHNPSRTVYLCHQARRVLG